METFWSTQHIEIIGLILLPLVAIWLDLRKQAQDNRRIAKENARIAQESAVNVEKRFTALETMITPVWDWFTNGRK